MKACKFILKATKFQLPNVYCFSTAEGKTYGCGWIPPPPFPEPFERLIMRITWDCQSTMISAEKLQLPMQFSQKINKHPSTIVLPWQQWVSHESNLCLEWKLVSLYWKQQSFNFLMFTVLARQREKHGCGWIPPPPFPEPFERLIMKITWDCQSTMISAEKLQLPTDFSQKLTSTLQQ